MTRRFARYPGAVPRAVPSWRRSLAFDLRLVAPNLPDFPMPGHFRSEMEYLRHLTLEGASGFYPGSARGYRSRAGARLEHELDIIERLGFAGYFLVVWDIVHFARSQDITARSGGRAPTRRCAAV